MDGFDFLLLKFNDSGLCELVDVDKKKIILFCYFIELMLLVVMMSVVKFIDDLVFRKVLEVKDEGSSDCGSIGMEVICVGIFEKLVVNIGFIFIEKEKGYLELVWKIIK